MLDSIPAHGNANALVPYGLECRTSRVLLQSGVALPQRMVPGKHKSTRPFGGLTSYGNASEK